jgi:uncharacterized protein (TIGR00369 family)
MNSRLEEHKSPPSLTADELTARLRAEFPEAFKESGGLSIDAVWHGGACVRQKFAPAMLRPGGTVSGPTMMALADVTMYVALLATIGWVPLAVTTQLNINFLRKPRPGDLIAEARLLKTGRRLAVGEVSIRSDGHDDIVAHATSTYAVPSGII